MAKIVYGLSGEGSGHSSRSREMITHLVQLGHEVKAVSYDRGYHNLKDDFDVFETEGLHIAMYQTWTLVGPKATMRSKPCFGSFWRITVCVPGSFTISEDNKLFIQHKERIGV